MKKRSLCIILALATMLGMSGCAGSKHNEQMRAKFCADNEILTYEPVDFEKTVITIGAYAPCTADPVELAIEAEFPNVDIVVLDQASIPDIQTSCNTARHTAGFRGYFVDRLDKRYYRKQQHFL